MKHHNDILPLQDPERTEGQPLRKAASLHCFEHLRGRSSAPRRAVLGNVVASKGVRSNSLGRFRFGRKQHAMSMQSSPVRRRELECGYAQPTDPVTDDNGERRAWALARLSVMLLLFVTFTDIAYRGVNHQMNQIESHEDYDALSPEVIRPAFLYKTNNHIDKPSLGLGSAAISSITDALSPILPFTGGVDLRRSEYYVSGNIFKNLYALVDKTMEAYANAKAEKDEEAANAVEESESKRKVRTSSKKGKRKHPLTLGATDSFVPLDAIAELTLEDVGVVFDYVIQNSNEGFNPTKYQNKALPRVKKVLQSIDSAVERSRGPGLDVQKLTAKTPVVGGTDAFLFCAAMRIFAEWRILRQVPDGYKGYAVGMSLGQKDVVQNVAKMERAAQAWIDHRSELGEDPVSPRLSDILQYELDTEEHPNLPRLKESSGAMGLLWVRRQLEYQTVIFENVLEVPDKFPEAVDAVSAAYSTVYGQYHGWAVQKIFNYSFQASPPVTVIYNFMDPHKLAEVKQVAKTMTSSAKIEESEEGFESESIDSPKLQQQQPPENIFHRIGWETERFVDGILQKLDKNKKRKEEKYSGEGLVGDELEQFIAAEMTKNSHDHILSYLEVAKPLLLDLARLFDEMNMDDPTKV